MVKDMEQRYQEILDYLSEGKYPVGYSKTQRLSLRRYAEKFTLKDGQLFVGSRRVIRSQQEARSLFSQLHSSPLGRHAGIVKTRTALNSRFFWHGMSVEINRWVSECEKCQSTCKSLATTQPSQGIKASAVWELVGIGLTGPLPKTEDGFKYILTAMDYFSKWVEGFPLKTKTASEVAQRICSIIYRHGCPKRILSGQGTEFVNELNISICALLGLEKSVIVAYHPQTNRLVGKTSHNIKRALTKMVNNQQSNWDVFLDATLFSLRSQIHTTTKHSPFLLMYGREAVFPSELPIDMPLSSVVFPEDSTYCTFLEEKKDLMKTVHEKTIENISESQEKYMRAAHEKRIIKKQNIVGISNPMKATSPSEHSIMQDFTASDMWTRPIDSDEIPL